MVIVPSFMVTVIFPFGFPLWSFPPNVFVIVPPFMVTSISPNTFGVNVESPWPPPNTFPIIPLLTITSTLSDDTVV